MAMHPLWDTGTWLEGVRRDVAFAARMLLRDPRFTGLAVLGLVLGISISMSVLTVARAAFDAMDVTAVVDRTSYVALLNRSADTDFPYQPLSGVPPSLCLRGLER